MAKFFDPNDRGDYRLHAPATARNRDVIFKVLETHINLEGTLLEIASGTGEHAAYMAQKLAPLMWQPTDIDENHLLSIDAWREDSGALNILPARSFNVLSDPWDFHGLKEPVTTVLAINLLHISPLEVTRALLKGCGTLLKSGGTLVTYGPYKRDGRHTAPSNEAFDASLKASNPLWGVRDMEEVTSIAAENGLILADTVEMPANNFSLIFKKIVR